jgi:hypothetical protein
MKEALGERDQVETGQTPYRGAAQLGIGKNVGFPIAS